MRARFYSLGMLELKPGRQSLVTLRELPLRRQGRSQAVYKCEARGRESKYEEILGN